MVESGWDGPVCLLTALVHPAIRSGRGGQYIVDLAVDFEVAIGVGADDPRPGVLERLTGPGHATDAELSRGRVHAPRREAVD